MAAAGFEWSTLVQPLPLCSRDLSDHGSDASFVGELTSGPCVLVELNARVRVLTACTCTIAHAYCSPGRALFCCL
jgi:hypothetical protein